MKTILRLLNLILVWLLLAHGIAWATPTVPAPPSAAATSRVMVANAAPTVADKVNEGLANTASATVLSPSLAGSDAENDLAYYTITGGLPTATQGVLLFNGAAVTTSTQITASQLSLLTFDPTTGYTGRVALTYKVTDRGALSSSAATYTIPVDAPNTISGVVYEDINYGGGTGSSQAACNGVGRNGATVELYTSAGVYSATTTTGIVNGLDGTYSFTGQAAGSYIVRVVNSTISSRAGYTSSLMPVQTYANGDGNRVGGEAPEKKDAGTNSGQQMLTALTPTGTTAQSLGAVTLAAGGAVAADFGFNFDTVVNTNDAGQGSLRQFIINANAIPNGDLNQRAFNNSGAAMGAGFPAGQETSIFMIADGTAKPGLRGGLTNQLTDASGTAATTNSRALITLTTMLPTVTNSSTAIDGTTQTTLNNSNPAILGSGGTVGRAATTLSRVNGPEVELSAPTSIANTIQVNANSCVLRGLAVRGGAIAVMIGANDAAGAAKTNMLVEQNVIGITALSVARPTVNYTNSIGLQLSNATGLVQNNIVAYNGTSGINYSAGYGTSGYVIRNNEIYQNGQVSAGGDGITLADQVLGGVATAGPITIENNLISTNNSSGIQLEIGKLGNNTIQNNTITGNGTGGVSTRLEGSGIHYLARTATVTSTNNDYIYNNIITANQSSAVVINYGQKNVRISQNSIYNNGNNTTGGFGLVAIDFTPPAYYVGGDARYGQGDGVTANDGLLDDGTTTTAPPVRQGNGGIDYPIITIANNNGKLRVSGFVGGNSAASRAKLGGAIIEVFSANDTDANQNGESIVGDGQSLPHGEAQYYLGSFPAAADGSFDYTFTGIAATLNAGDIVTATAYLPGYGTSECGTNQKSTFVVLPVELVRFEAKAQGRQVQLTWATAAEKNNSRFEVECSPDGQAFEQIGTVAGHGTTTQQYTYSFTDTKAGALTGPVYYRLRQVDTSGEAAYSPVRVVTLEAAATKFTISPNPTCDNVTLDLTALPAGQYHVSVLDLSGRTLREQTTKGAALTTLNVAALPAGVYLVLVRGARQVLTQRLAKY